MAVVGTPIPRMMQQIMVRNSATRVGLMKGTELLRAMTMPISLEARPVAVMHPAITPAMAQATATVMVPLPPASRASRILFRLMRLSLSNRFTAMVTRMAMLAENCMVRVLVVTRATSTTSGSSR